MWLGGGEGDSYVKPIMEGLPEEVTFKQHRKEEMERAIQIAGRGAHFTERTVVQRSWCENEHAQVTGSVSGHWRAMGGNGVKRAKKVRSHRVLRLGCSLC